MKQTNLFKIVVVFFLILPFFPLTASPHDDNQIRNEFNKTAESVRNLLKDISTINLLNGLYLTRDQAEKILALARAFRDEREAHKGSEPLLVALKDAEHHFQSLRQEIQKGAPARGELPKQAGKANKRIKALHEVKNKRLKESLAVYDSRVREILTDEQMTVVNTFKTCLIPPTDLRNPVRAGQAASNKGVVKKLRRIRRIPDTAWEKNKNKIAAKSVDRLSTYKFHMTEREKQDEMKRMITIIERAREMSDTEFELEKEQIAKDLEMMNNLDELKKEIAFRNPRPGPPKPSRAVKFLLTDRIIPILEERLNNQVAWIQR